MEKHNALTASWQRNAPLLRLLLLGFLILLLQIPILMIDGQINDRRAISQQASQAVMQQWGGKQLIAGPRLIVPYTHQWREKDSNTKIDIIKSDIRYLSLLPTTLSINGEARTEQRYRGIYEIPVYQSSLVFEGQFSQPDVSTLGIKADALMWHRAQLLIHASDTKAIQNNATLTWDAQTLNFKPGNGHLIQAYQKHKTHNSAFNNGIHADLQPSFNQQGFKNKPYKFTVKLDINGSHSLRFLPMGNNTVINLKANWPNPSFQGQWLPDQRQITDAGFTAKWHIPNLGRNFPDMWIINGDIDTQIQATAFGVELLTPVDNYRMAERSIKYQILFLLLTFLTLWLFEILTNTTVHPIQYLFVGASLCLFYLLELSLSEHIDFMAAYLLAASLVISQISAYTWFILKHKKRTGMMATLLILLYSYLYILLQEQELALLFGTLGLFIALCAIMFITRHIDWNNLAGDEHKKQP